MGIIVKPLVTEKMTAITEKLNRFGFIVRPEANKLEIKKEVEALYIFFIREQKCFSTGKRSSVTNAASLTAPRSNG